MRKENLLIDCNIKAIKERLKTTLANIEIQKGVMMWDDKEKIEHCIYALEILEEEEKEKQNKLEKCWITFLHTDFLDCWVPLTDWENKPVFWEQKNSREIKKIASQKFPNIKFALSNCTYKKMNECLIDNF
tara:strand:- start:275 stop:667 length:393 start_codon:yes stop_codon:yes gene_type:complete